jgi:hypothetical protein
MVQQLTSLLIRIPGIEAQALIQCCTCAGNMLKSHTMGWHDLPLELEEQVLSNLSLVELALLSSTRKVFLAAFRKQLAEEQKALCDEAHYWFGATCLKRAAEISSCFLKEPTLQMDKLGKIRVRFTGKWGADGPILKLYDRVGSRLEMQIFRKEGGLIEFNPILGRIGPGWVAVVQVFLSEVPLPFLDGQTVRVYFPWQPPLTLVEVKAQIAPLLPLVARCTVDGRGQGASITIKEPRHVGQVGSGANKGITLIVDCGKCIP